MRMIFSIDKIRMILLNRNRNKFLVSAEQETYITHSVFKENTRIFRILMRSITKEQLNLNIVEHSYKVS